jgi:hypothetical protein
MEMMLQNKVAVIYGAGAVETVANCTDEKKAHCESNWGNGPGWFEETSRAVSIYENESDRLNLKTGQILCSA